MCWNLIFWNTKVVRNIPLKQYVNVFHTISVRLCISFREVIHIKDLGLFERSPLQIHLNLFDVQFIAMQHHCKQPITASWVLFFLFVFGFVGFFVCLLVCFPLPSVSSACNVTVLKQWDPFVILRIMHFKWCLMNFSSLRLVKEKGNRLEDATASDKRPLAISNDSDQILYL